VVRFEGKSRCGVYLEEYVVMSLICCQPTLFYHYHSRWALYIPILICFDADSYSVLLSLLFLCFFGQIGIWPRFVYVLFVGFSLGSCYTYCRVFANKDPQMRESACIDGCWYTQFRGSRRALSHASLLTQSCRATIFNLCVYFQGDSLPEQRWQRLFSLTR